MELEKERVIELQSKVAHEGSCVCTIASHPKVPEKITYNLLALNQPALRKKASLKFLSVKKAGLIKANKATRLYTLNYL